jgi:hypothetical protein
VTQKLQIKCTDPDRPLSEITAPGAKKNSPRRRIQIHLSDPRPRAQIHNLIAPTRNQRPSIISAVSHARSRYTTLAPRRRRLSLSIRTQNTWQRRRAFKCRAAAAICEK